MSIVHEQQPGLTEALRLALIAHRFYVEGVSKLQIADEFRISRFKVARLLMQARASRLVEVRFHLPQPIDIALSDRVRRAYGLDRAIVVQPGSAEDPRPVMRRRIGVIAAALLSEVVTADDVLGLVWARSVNVLVDSLVSLPGCPVVQLCGVHGGMRDEDRSVETVWKAATASGGPAFPIFAPLVLPDRQTAETLRRQPGIADAFRQFSKITKAVVSIGAWAPGESTVFDTVDEAEQAAVAASGVTAEVAARLFDADGHEISATLSHHVLAITVDELFAVPEVIALGYGEPKAPAIDSILRSGLVTTLITDSPAAAVLLRLAELRPAPSARRRAGSDARPSTTGPD
jgi:DNA-binding transcriptional regulator LsrR (DeoR family)